MGIKKICVCGAGTMGRGIAQVAAQNGFETVLYDVDPSMVEPADAAISQNLQLLVEKNKLKPVEKDTILSRLQFTDNLQDCKAELIIEAIIEQSKMKINLFNELAGFNTRDTILATNTSSLSISEIAKAIENPGRVIGMHFFNPAPVMKLVEVIKGINTSELTILTVFSVARQMNKTPVLCKDVPGFIVNRVARPYYIESLRLIEEGFADFSTIDELLESSGFKMGPFKLMDLIGNDINFAVSSSVYRQLGEPPRLKPSRIQQEKVNQGELGKKTGKGYYNYGPHLPDSPEGGNHNSHSPLQGGQGDVG
jgi:3-hydroxybutyryl-CoA dehydrogenase